MCRIVCISDTHSLHKIMDDINPIPKGDILIHAGDCTNVGAEYEIKEFIQWFKNIEGFKTKIWAPVPRACAAQESEWIVLVLDLSAPDLGALPLVRN